VILDLTIRGGLGGAETIRRLREIEPRVKAVVSSGYAADGVVADYRRYGFSAALSKPYTLAGLRDVLDGLMRRT
jgi:CheY-like chemotaxis protein